MTIIRNAIMTPDGSVIESRTRHDFVTYTDKNGKQYMVDGGLNYLRRCGHFDYTDLSVSLEDGHEKVREALTWGTYGKNGDHPLRYVLLKDMTSNHLQACLDNVPNMYAQIRQAMKNELEWREEE